MDCLIPDGRADPLVVNRLRQILEPTRTEEEPEAELLEDQDTTWLGYCRDAPNVSQIYDYRRFSAILAEAHIEETGERCPQLTSFIGETDFTLPQESGYYSPVTTSSHQNRIATTGDMHLYADPSILYTVNPSLFVDCEGLSGAKVKTVAGLVVSQLYPRILYTFSDCVIFVLQNPRSFESTVLNRLIKWGAASIDKSINQPVLPHVTDPDVDEKESNTDALI
ncbi:hypothetical protein EV127DRAFT_403722 [Xylaria flabelliformis]|nr:hypothetical protein EV127DRAFT_403722 [Xylaria flabelliformis]